MYIINFLRKSCLYSKLRSICKKCILLFSFIIIIFFIFALTSGPYWIIYWLGTSNIKFSGKPEFIIMMGGSGMPSESNLIRSYYASTVAKQFPDSKIIIALPGDTTDLNSALIKIKEELCIRGIDENRIFFENKGRNTREQAIHIVDHYSKRILSEPVGIVTSPEHMKRSILTFRKIGFKDIGGYPSFEYAIECDVKYDDDLLGGNKYVPDIGDNLNLRYQFWNHMKYEIIFIREFLALGYYKVKGWI